MIHNRSQAVVQELAERGLEPVNNAAELAQRVGSGLIFICVTNNAATQAVFDAIINDVAAGALIVDMGSNKVDDTRDWCSRARERGADWLDAPVSGGEVGACDATLTIMCGGSAAAFERARPWLERLGRTVRHMGESGTGQITKLANQIIVAAQIAAVSEAFTLAQAHGVTPLAVRDALMGGFAASRILDVHGKRMSEGNYQPGGTAVNQLKDVHEGLRVARAAGLDLPLLEKNGEIWEAMIAAGLGQLDHSALFKYYCDKEHR